MSRESNPFVSPEWLDIQRRYLETLAAAGRPEEEADAEPAAQWQRAMEQWWEAILPRVPDASRSYFDNLLHQSRSFFAMTEEFARLVTDMAGAGGNWQSLLSRRINLMKERLQGFAVPGAEEIDPSQPWRSLLESWNRALAVMPDELFRGADGDALRSITDRFLALPAAGPGADYLAVVRDTLKLWGDYQEHCRHYCRVFHRLGSEALDRLEQRIRKRGSEEKPITSLRELYALWIDCNEEVYAEFAAGEEYAVLYADLVSSLMAFRRQSRKLLDVSLRQLELPTTETVAALTKSQLELRRQLQQTLAEQRRAQSEIEALKAELEDLHRRTGPPRQTAKKKRARTPDPGRRGHKN
ncbi:MAG: poly(R)-hydroxyalkanoic acid synthase subunit PhaE [Gammaproteobacteria bacterium]